MTTLFLCYLFCSFLTFALWKLAFSLRNPLYFYSTILLFMCMSLFFTFLSRWYSTLVLQFSFVSMASRVRKRNTTDHRTTSIELARYSSEVKIHAASQPVITPISSSSQETIWPSLLLGRKWKSHYSLRTGGGDSNSSALSLQGQ